MKVVNQPVMKKDAMSLVTGKPVFLDDVVPDNALVVKVKRSPYAHALIEEIKIDTALKVPGIEAIYTYKDVPDIRFTMAGQTYPEPSPYDRLILDQRVRFVGDAVAIVAGENEKAVEKALRLIKVKYQELEPVLDFHTAKDNPILVHPEDNWESKCPVGADNKRNLCASEVSGHGDIEAVLKDCDLVVEHTYHTKADQQAMMETFRTYTNMDAYGRLNIISSTQIVFHVRRIVATALGIPKSKVRVSKPRIGGGFGAKQTLVAEIYPAFVTWKTGKAAKMIFTREESQTASTPRHEMEVTIRLGAMKDGRIRAIDLYTLSNTGAYGEHGPTTVGLSLCCRLFHGFYDCIGMRTPQYLDNQTILRRQIIYINRLSGYQREGILFDHRLIHTAELIGSSRPVRFIDMIFSAHDAPPCCFFQARKFKIPRSCPSYPEQRQRFPARYSLISSSLGSGFSRNSAIAFIIIPGLQNPHCSAPCPAIKEPNSSASSCRPSSVSTLHPFARAASTEHDSTGFPSRKTVHSPQFDVSQPRFTL